MDYTTMEGGRREVPSMMQWKEVTPMPSPKNGLRGASIGGIFHVVGGNSDYSMQDFSKEIIAWDPVLESWKVAGHLNVGRVYAGVTEVPLLGVLQNCSAPTF